jgi:hypothetical protein
MQMLKVQLPTNSSRRKSGRAPWLRTTYLMTRALRRMRGSPKALGPRVAQDHVRLGHSLFVEHVHGAHQDLAEHAHLMTGALRWDAMQPDGGTIGRARSPQTWAARASRKSPKKARESSTRRQDACMLAERFVGALVGLTL